MTQAAKWCTIEEAAAIWITMIQAPGTKATQEEKDALIAKIQAAAPKAKVMGIGYPDGVPADKAVLFTDACNAIKRVIREAK